MRDRLLFRSWARRNPEKAWSTFKWRDIPPHRQDWFRAVVFTKRERIRVRISFPTPFTRWYK